MYRASLLLYRTSYPEKIRLILTGCLIVGFSALHCTATEIPLFTMFSTFDKIYEPSGVQQLPDGRFIIVEDESHQPLDILSLEPDGRISEQALYRSSPFSLLSPNRALSTLEDLEAVATDDQGHVYVITSHSRKNNGSRDIKREQLARFTLDGDRVVDFQVLRGLQKKIFHHHRSLERASHKLEAKDGGGFDIEGLSFDVKKQKLLIGLRNPLAGENAIIVVVENGQTLFDNNVEPHFADTLIELDLDGGGIRAMSYDPYLCGYLLLSRKPSKRFKLWLWSGDAKESPQRLRVPDVKNLRQAEGITPVRLQDGQTGILIVSDDGNRVQGKPGHFLFLRYEQLIRK